MTPPDEGSARRRHLYLTTRNAYNRQTTIHPAGIEPAIPAIERQKTYALDITTTGIGNLEDRTTLTWNLQVLRCVLNRIW